MYQFLCLYGPGILAWVSEVLYSGKKEEEEKGILLAVAKMIAYSLVDMAVVTTVCRPLGRVQFVTALDGTFTVLYGVSALAAAVLVAVILGIGMALLRNRSSCSVLVDKKTD